MRAATRSRIAESPGAAGPLLRLVPVDDPRHATWKDFAQCKDADPEAFFPEDRGPGTTAKKLCAVCPVRPQCLQYALDNNEEHGIWGGLGRQARKKLVRASQEHVREPAPSPAAEVPPGRYSETALQRMRDRRLAPVVQRLETGEKLCTGPCGETKPLARFSARASAPDGLQAQCKQVKDDLKAALRKQGELTKLLGEVQLRIDELLLQNRR